MSQSSAARTLNDVPSFDVVDALTPVGSAPCAECRGPIVDTYFETDRGVICDTCHTRAASRITSGSTGGRLGRAMLFGVIGAVVGTTLYFGVLATTGREVTVVAVLVGFIVGKAVRLGARGRGGRRLQWLAVCLTYLAIVTTYLPFVLKGFGRASAPAATIAAPATTGDAFPAIRPVAPPAAPSRTTLGATTVDFGALLLLAAAAPALEAATHPLTLAIVVLALAAAWRMNRQTDVKMRGPYHVRPTRA